MKSKILFITPPYHCGVVEVAGRWIPLHLVYLAGSAREAGFDCEIYDAMSLDATHDDIVRVIEETRPDFVATSCITSTYPDGLQIMRSAHCTHTMEMRQPAWAYLRASVV